MAEIVLVEVPKVGCTHGTRWAKALTSVVERAASGNDYEGDWLHQGQARDLEVGTVLVLGGYTGSLKNGSKTADFYVVGPGGRPLHFLSVEDRQWAIRAREEARLVLGMGPAERVRYAAREELDCYPCNFRDEWLQKVVEAGGRGASPGLPSLQDSLYGQGTGFYDPRWETATPEQKQAALEKAQADLDAALRRRRRYEAALGECLVYGLPPAQPEPVAPRTAQEDLLSAVEVLFPEDDWARYQAVPLVDPVSLTIVCTAGELLALRDALVRARRER